MWLGVAFFCDGNLYAQDTKTTKPDHTTSPVNGLKKLEPLRPFKKADTKTNRLLTLKEKQELEILKELQKQQEIKLQMIYNIEVEKAFCEAKTRMIVFERDSRGRPKKYIFVYEFKNPITKEVQEITVGSEEDALLMESIGLPWDANIFINSMASGESTNDYNAKNPYSGAYGYFQYLPETWKKHCEFYSKHFGTPLSELLLQSKKNQSRVGRYNIIRYFRRESNWTDVVCLWYSGRVAKTIKKEGWWYRPQPGGHPSVHRHLNKIKKKYNNTIKFLEEYNSRKEQ